LFQVTSHRHHSLTIHETMITRVETHNRFNGFGFVIGELSLIGVVALVFAVLYLAKGSGLPAVACAGITVNSIVVNWLAVRSLRRGVEGIGIWRIYTQREVRDQVMREHPGLSTETLLITLAVLAPFLLLLIVAVEASRR
jgi:hypothetical protein